MNLEEELSKATLKKIEQKDLIDAYASLYKDKDFKIILRSFENAKIRKAKEALFAKDLETLKYLQGQVLTYKLIKDLAKYCYKLKLKEEKNANTKKES